MKSLDIVILAAGQGTRMRSRLPKVLQPLAGQPLLSHVITTSKDLQANIHVVIGHCSDLIRQQFSDDDINWIIQDQQLGTGHAVQQALHALHPDGMTLVLYGDVPLVKKSTLELLVEKVSNKSMALLTVDLAVPQGYGRIIRNTDCEVIAIVEEKDATTEQREITEVNTGILAIETQLLSKILPRLSADNSQKEYYLTDIIEMAVNEKIIVETVCTADTIEVQGINDKKQLAMLERAFQMQNANDLMEQGVTILDPSRIDIRGVLKVGMDVTIDVNCIFQGEVLLADNVSIGPNCIIGESGCRVEIGKDVIVKANTIIESATVAEGCVIGPFARIRPGTVLAKNARIGNFVETKKSVIGEGSKVNHLTYIGDSLIGQNVNIGAGTITCNYDGANKHQTIIEDDVFIGSNAALVAPVKIEKGATVAAGSTITKTVEAGELALARAKQKNIKGWPRPQKKT